MKKKLRVLSLHLLLLLTGFTGTLFSQTSEEFVKLKKDTTKEVKGTNIELKADELHRFSNGFVILGNYLIPIQDSLVESKVESITPFTIFDLLERDTTSTKQQIKFSKKVDKVYVNNKIVSSPNEIDEEFTLIKFLPKNTTSPVLALRAKEYKRLSEVYEILNISMSYSGLSRDSTSADDKPSRDSTNSLTKDPLDPRFFNWKDGYWMVPVFWCIVGISVGLLLYMLIARFTSKPQQNSEDTTKKTLTGQPLDQSSSDAEVPAVSGQPSSAENGMELAPPINTSQASLEDIKSIFNQTLEPLTNQQEQTSKLLTMLNEKLDSIIRPLPQENTTPSVKLEQYADVLALKRFVEVIDKNVEETFTVINNHFFKSNEDSEVLSTIRAITYNYHHPVDPFPKQNTPNSKWLAILNRIEDNQGEITDAFFLDEFQRVTNGAAQINQEVLFCRIFAGTYRKKPSFMGGVSQFGAI